jgi:hypothetical protein
MNFYFRLSLSILGGNMSKPKLIQAMPCIDSAAEQYLMAAADYEANPSTESYANLLRAAMVVNTKKIALTEAEMLELRQLKNTKEPA